LALCRRTGNLSKSKSRHSRLMNRGGGRFGSKNLGGGPWDPSLGVSIPSIPSQQQKKNKNCRHISCFHYATFHFCETRAPPAHFGNLLYFANSAIIIIIIIIVSGPVLRQLFVEFSRDQVLSVAFKLWK